MLRGSWELRRKNFNGLVQHPFPTLFFFASLYYRGWISNTFSFLIIFAYEDSCGMKIWPMWLKLEFVKELSGNLFFFFPDIDTILPLVYSITLNMDVTAGAFAAMLLPSENRQENHRHFCQQKQNFMKVLSCPNFMKNKIIFFQLVCILLIAETNHF